jgi:hypothetical protein
MELIEWEYTDEMKWEYTDAMEWQHPAPTE